MYKVLITPKRLANSGFTLIEVLIAAMILALSLPVLMRAFSDTTLRLNSQSQETPAVELIQNKLKELTQKPYEDLVQQHTYYELKGEQWREQLNAYTYITMQRTTMTELMHDTSLPEAKLLVLTAYIDDTAVLEHWIFPNVWSYFKK